MKWQVRLTWSQIFIAVGLAAMLVGFIDPLEGWPAIVGGSAAVAAGAELERSQHRVLILVSAGLVASGAVAMFLLSRIGGIGGNSGNSMWWGVTILPYPIGWAIELVAGVLAFIETIKKSRAQRPSV